MLTFARSASILLVLRRVPLLEIVLPIIHVSINTIVNHKVILCKSPRNDGLVLILSDFVVQRRIRFALRLRRVVFQYMHYTTDYLCKPSIDVYRPRAFV